MYHPIFQDEAIKTQEWPNLHQEFRPKISLNCYIVLGASCERKRLTIGDP